LPHTTQTTVLNALDGGLSPSEVVRQLVSDALAIGRGETPSNAEDLAEGSWMPSCAPDRWGTDSA
jgi:hypothetical protein